MYSQVILLDFTSLLTSRREAQIFTLLSTYFFQTGVCTPPWVQMCSSEFSTQVVNINYIIILLLLLLLLNYHYYYNYFHNFHVCGVVTQLFNFVLETFAYLLIS